MSVIITDAHWDGLDRRGECGTAVPPAPPGGTAVAIFPLGGVTAGRRGCLQMTARKCTWTRPLSRRSEVLALALGLVDSAWPSHQGPAEPRLGLGGFWQAWGGGGV